MAPSGPDEVVLATPAHLNVNRISRELRRADLSLRNCLLSVDEDAQHVARIAALFDLPVVANLRCGRWYVAEPHSEAYFKVRSPGPAAVTIHTQPGKFLKAAASSAEETASPNLSEPSLGAAPPPPPPPHSQPPQSTDGHSGNWTFSTARLNWHVATLAAARGGCLLVDATRSATKRFPDALSKTVPIWAAVLNAAVAVERGSSAADACAASGLALPPWIAESEAAAIQQRLPDMLAALLTLGPDVAALAAALRRPLRCVWLSQASPLWAVPDAAALPFTPIVCISASAPLLGCGQRHAGYSYVPGAGDDEESWSGGLTARLFARHRGELLAAAASQPEPELDKLVRRLQGERTEAGAGAASPAPSARLLVPSGPALRAFATGLHDLPPVGVRAGGEARAQLPLSHGRISVLGDSHMRLASFAALQRGDALWTDADAALLLVDGRPGCAEAAAADAQELLRPPEPGRLLCLRVLRAHGSAGVGDRGSLLAALPAALVFASESLRAGRRLLVACADGCERSPAAAVALLAALFASPCGGALELLPPDAPPPPASKPGLRRWLALVSSHHPEARPTRGLLKQAYQFQRLLSGECDQSVACVELDRYDRAALL